MSRCAIPFTFFDLYIHNIYIMLSYGESVKSNFFANYRSDDKINKN